jgi:hypothetical protein
MIPVWLVYVVNTLSALMLALCLCANLWAGNTVLALIFFGLGVWNTKDFIVTHRAIRKALKR